MVLYHTTEYRETDIEVEAAIAVHPKYVAQESLNLSLAEQELVNFREVPGHDLGAGLIFEGSFYEMRSVVLALVGWIGTHQHVPVGPLREAHLSGPVHAEDAVAEENVTELQIPIAPIREP